MKDRRLVECHFEDHGESFTVGEIYLGTVKKVVPGLNAAFIDIGYEKDAFLHYLDLGPQVRSTGEEVEKGIRFYIVRFLENNQIVLRIEL